MIDFATLSKDLLEKKLETGELKILKPERQEKLFDLKSAFIKERKCPYHDLPLKKTLKGDYFCRRSMYKGGPKCAVWIPKKTIDGNK